MVDRRGFFQRAAAEGVAAFEQLRGRPHYRLADLPQLEDSLLREIIPVVRPDVEVACDGELVQARTPGSSEPIILFGAAEDDDWDRFIFHSFNGRSAIGEISDQLCRSSQSDHLSSFRRVRRCFLRLVQLGVLVPANAVG